MSTLTAAQLTTGRWSVRPVAAAALRAGIVAVPLPMSAAVGVLVGWSIGGNSAAEIVARVAVAGMASMVTFLAVQWLALRLLPLAVLLRLSLVFPDRAPSRFSVAMRSTSVRRLRDWAQTNQDRLDEQALAEKVLTLAAALNFHDRRTRGHSERTRALAELIVEELGLSEAEANEIRWGAFLHDIGKLLVPAAVLNKPGAPSPAEWEQLRQHPAEGGRLVRPLRPFIGSGVDAVAFHHESYDGSGYPNGFRGDDIPLAARIVAVVDSFEVMTAVRSYKRPMPAATARQELVREAGAQFDPRVVRAFLSVSLGRVHWALGLAAWAAELPFIGVVPRAAAQVSAAMGAGSSAVTTATLASVATASLGASLIVNPLAAVVPAAASAPPAASVSMSPSASNAGAGSATERAPAPTAAGTNASTTSHSAAGPPGPATAGSSALVSTGARSASGARASRASGTASHGPTSTSRSSSTHRTAGGATTTSSSGTSPAASSGGTSSGSGGSGGGDGRSSGTTPVNGLGGVVKTTIGTVTTTVGKVVTTVGTTLGTVTTTVGTTLGTVTTTVGTTLGTVTTTVGTTVGKVTTTLGTTLGTVETTLGTVLGKLGGL